MESREKKKKKKLQLHEIGTRYVMSITKYHQGRKKNTENEKQKEEDRVEI